MGPASRTPSRHARGLLHALTSPSAQDGRVFPVHLYMAVQPEIHGDVPEAEIKLPADWLMPWLELETVRQAQRSDTQATMTAENLMLSGVELVVERRWLREAYWRKVKDAITRGYIYKSSLVQLTLRGDRRERERRTATSRAA